MDEEREQHRTKAEAEASLVAVEVTILDLQAKVAKDRAILAYLIGIEDFKKSEEFKQIKLDFRTESYEEGIGYAVRKIQEHHLG